MSNSLKQKATKGILWSCVERFSSQGISFLITLVLARLLTPDDYGTIAMLTIFMAIAQVFIDSGFSSALIRKQDRTDKDFSTMFFLNIGIGIATYFVLFLISPLVANFYDKPILAPLLKVLALVVVFNSLCVVQQTLQTIEIDFKTQAKVTLLATIISGLVGVYLAYSNCGIWSLVTQQVLGSILRMLLLWHLSKWRPREHFSKESFYYLFGFGSKLLASGFIATIYNNLTMIVIGKIFNSTALGNYSRAGLFGNLLSANITEVIRRVSYPIFCEFQNDEAALQDKFRKLLKMSAFIIFPLMILLAAVADPLIRILLTDKWEGCIILLQIMCFGFIWSPIMTINANMLQVKGRSDLFLRLEIINKSVGIFILCISTPFGVISMCIGGVVLSLFYLIHNISVAGRLIKVGLSIQLKDLYPIFLNSLLMGIIVYAFINEMDSHSRLLGLIGGFLIGSIYYLGSSYLLHFNEMHLILRMTKQIINR